MTMDAFSDKHMTSNANQNINVLLIDTEGYDFDVLKGAEKTLERVEYLEFEFSSAPRWMEFGLIDVIDYMDEKGFTCYWAGWKKLWRITGCWQKHFAKHQWSNVACVNNALKPELAQKMEEVFEGTLAPKKKK